MFGLLEELNREGKTILFVTHDRDLRRGHFWVVDVVFSASTWLVLVVSLLVGLLALRAGLSDRHSSALLVYLRDVLEASCSTLRRPGLGRPALAAGKDPARHDADRVAQRRTAQAAEPGHGLDRVALAVGNLLAVLGVAAAATEASRRSWSSHREDLQVSTSGRDLFDAEAEREIRATPGVAEAEPVLKNTVVLNGHRRPSLAVGSLPDERARSRP